MRQDFRVKLDFSKIYQDVRQHSWVYVDSTKILLVNHLAEHIEKLFDIKKPFHLLSRYEEMYFFLPFQEDVRILENNDTVLIVPGTGIAHACEVKNDESSHNLQNGFVEPVNKVKQNNSFSEKSHMSEKSCLTNTVENISEVVSSNDTLYKTAFHETAADDTKVCKMEEDIFTEDNSITEESTMSNKRKRVRKRKQKKLTEVAPESDASVMESSGKKPKIIDSIMISSGKHIRFKGLDDEDTTSDINALNESNIPRAVQNGCIENKQFINKDLSALLKLRQQTSTPLTFTHKRMKRESELQPINTTPMNVESSEISNKSTVELEKTRENSQLNKSTADDDTVSFKVFRIGEDYTPQLSSVILAKVLSCSTDGQYTMKILHGKDQLEEPEGKFSLPKDESADFEDETNDIITIEKSKLLELTKVKAIGATS